MKYKLIYILLSAFSIYSATAQSSSTPTLQKGQKCGEAHQLCGKIYHEHQSYEGAESFPSIASICTTLDANRVWYTFTIKTSGILQFLITPDDPVEKFNFALFKANNCQGINLNSNVFVSSNFSNLSGSTGIKAGSLSSHECQTSTVTFNAPLTVTQGEVFYLMVSTATVQANGYEINFSNSTAQIGDDTPPEISKAEFYQSGCSTKVIVDYNEPVLVNLLAPADPMVNFKIKDPSNNIVTSTGLVWDYTFTGSGMAKKCTLSFPSSFILNPGNYYLWFDGVVRDICGNMLEITSIPITNELIGTLPITVENTTDACNVRSFKLCIQPNSSYTKVSLYRDGRIDQEINTPSSTFPSCFLINEFGNYSIKVTGGSICSTFTTSIVVD